MSWSIEEHIGEGRPWPGKIEVYRGETSECLAYVSGEVVDMLIAENIKLRTQLANVTESMGRVEERCAKLRELVRDYDYCVMHSDCSRCKYDGKPSTHCPLSPCFPDTGELYELGIEVSDE